jgi:hypothetical protein
VAENILRLSITMGFNPSLTVTSNEIDPIKMHRLTANTGVAIEILLMRLSVGVTLF